MDIYLLNYNNYYNRIIKLENTITDYLQYMISNSPFTNINFNPNDGINAELIINWNYNQWPDYMVAANGNEIISRWFIIETQRTRAGQYKFSFKRDVVADHYNVVVNSPCFIEKATVGNDDPAIYNSEDMTFNQIKQSETLLKDYTGCPWVVGYFARGDADNPSKSYSGEIASLYPADIEVKDAEGNLTTLDQWEYYSYIGNNKLLYPSALAYSFNYYLNYIESSGVDTYWNNRYNFIGTEGNNIQLEQNNTMEYSISVFDPIPNYFDYLRNNNLINNGINTLVPLTQQQVFNFLDVSISNNLKNIDGLLIKYIENGKAVTKKVSLNKTNITETRIPLQQFPIMSFIDSTAKSAGWIGQATTGTLQVYIQTTQINISLEDIVASGINVKFDIPSNRYHLQDSPYDMFCIPYSDKFELYLKDDKTNQYAYYNTSQSVALSIGSGITGVLTSSVVYDIQLLPYCPIRGFQVTKIGDKYQAVFNDQVEADQYGYSFLRTTATAEPIVGFILYASSSSFTFNIPLENAIQPDNYKISHLTDKYRLCSPNYNGVFEFSAAANDGISAFNVDCTYLPHQPYMHLNPDFSGLYGQDFNDSRGLIVGGDFSLPQTSEAWQNYLLNNKNYLVSFNRQIENMEINNYYTNLQGDISAVAGSITGAASGAMAGALVGGPVGAVAGAVGGGLLSGAGGIADAVIRRQLQAEAIDYTKDQFGYQLGNIKALPTGLSRVTAYTYNNKIFPFLEYYTCTETEKQALINKLKYNGMTIGRIGTISEFLQTVESYIKGKIIRLESIVDSEGNVIYEYSDDMHMSTAIAEEIYKGVFIK